MWDWSDFDLGGALSGFPLFINKINNFSAALICLWCLGKLESNFGIRHSSALDHHGHGEAHLQSSPHHPARDAGGGGSCKGLCARRNSIFRAAYPSLRAISHVLQSGLGVQHGNGT